MLDKYQKKVFEEVANTIRGLSMDGVEKANSGHPGLPLGCAELGAVLWGEFLNYNPKDEDALWRDHFVLSAGHGSMFLYSALHLAGYKVSLDDLKNFRQKDSITPGHPEKLDTEGVEVTTGPLGQGVANAVGIALGLKVMAAKYNQDGFDIFNNKVVCLAGDGCLMEGVSHEASSLAGHLCLDNFILLYDRNNITLDGAFSDSCSDDDIMRYKSYGFDVVEIENGNDIEEVYETLMNLRNKQEKPLLVVCNTVIGFGSPHKAGTHKAHGSPLGDEEITETKRALGMSEEKFYVPASVKDFFKEREEIQKKNKIRFDDMMGSYEKNFPKLAKELKEMKHHKMPKGFKEALSNITFDEKISGRKASAACLQLIAKHVPALIGGSADLSGSDCTKLEDYGIIKRGDFSGRNIKYGVREFSMAAIANGMSTLHLRPFIGTFFCFSDYMRNAIRLASLSKHPTLFVFTHDSIFLGEDGPTHQPVEHLASLRAMPGLDVFRPGDANEVAGSWFVAMNKPSGPSALIFTRQNLPTLQETKRDFDETVAKGAYVLVKEDSSRKLDMIIIGTGSELHLAKEVAESLSSDKFSKNVRVVSMPCMDIFHRQEKGYQESVVGGDCDLVVSIEAGTSFGWERYTGRNGLNISIDTFGKSEPIDDLKNDFGFTVDQVIEQIMTSTSAKV
ncbi:MAG: Transketolase [Chlamydiia bacterium]|nr:Transketolase [Chlamydiia bacterium]